MVVDHLPRPAPAPQDKGVPSISNVRLTLPLDLALKVETAKSVGNLRSLTIIVLTRSKDSATRL